VSIHPSRTRSRFLAAVAGAGLVAASLATGGAATAAPPSAGSSVDLTDGSYVVIFRQAPSTTYDGGVAGYAATKAPNGKSFEHSRAAVQKYEAYLAGQQTQALTAVGAQPVYSYTTAINAAAVTLTAEQAAQLVQRKDVLAVAPDEARTVDTVSSPAFLGLEGSNGNVWQQIGGTGKAGAGIVVGVVDTGYWPESASFAGAPMATAGSVSATSPGPVWSTAKSTGAVRSTLFYKADGTVFSGACVPGAHFLADTCNSKVISARYFDSGFVSSVKRSDWSPTEYLSPRDGAGHGSHTASTAAGNHGVPMSIEGRDFGTGSGMAPAAKLAIYKVCWEAADPDDGGCFTSDSVAAINQAVKDGVDVINFSISGATNTVVDAVEYAFFGAASAGVFVAASAGNSGPDVSTVAHNSPWVTTVAASTHALYEGTVQLGAGGAMYKGASISATGLPTQTATVLSTNVAASTGTAATEAARLCGPGSLNPAAVIGKIVVCDRGVYDRVAKSAEVKRAGGVGMILTNTSPNSLDADFHSVPTVHVDDVAGAAIKAALAGGGTTALLPGNQTGVATPVPQIAGFSSRGPALANDSSLLKPDISAPGVSVIAAVAPPSNSGRDFDVYSGTSMSSPHIAGLSALYLGVHPLWTPAAVKSAMMTTAYDLKNPDGSAATDPFAQGAGHVDPTRFFEPGLVLQAGQLEWAKFFGGQGLDFGVGSMDPSDLNYPSIAVGQLAGVRTITRTFTAVTPGRYKVAVSVPGFDVTTSAKSLSFARVGDTKSLDITFTRSTAPLAAWSTGFVTLTGPETVRMPVALRPVSVSAPAEVSGSGAAGSVGVTVGAGFTGSLQVSHAGFAEGKVTAGSVAPGETLEYVVDVPARTSLARFDLDAANDGADLDLYVYRMDAAGTKLVALAGQSATGSADERVDLRNPTAGTYYVVAEGFANAAGESTTAFTETDYLVTPDTNLGSMTVTPNPVPVTQGADSTFSVGWSGLDAMKPYLGWVGYDGALAPTVVSVN
jgi:phage tail protein X